MRTSTAGSFAVSFAASPISIFSPCLARGLSGQSDPVIISWAATNGRVLVTHDVNTMLDAALDCIRTRQSMAGLVVVPQHMRIGQAISDLALIVTCVEPQELDGQVWYLPL